METTYLKINEEDYEKCKDNIRKLRNWVFSHAPHSLIYGYGIYGYKLCERDGKKMVELTIGSSCD